MVYSNYIFLCSYGANQLLNLFSDPKNSITVALYAMLPDDSTEAEMQQVLEDSKERSRSKLIL